MLTRTVCLPACLSADMSGLDPLADTYVASLAERLGWQAHLPLLQYAWRLRRKLAEAPLSLDYLSEPVLRDVPWPSATEPDDRFRRGVPGDDGLLSVGMFGRWQVRSLHGQLLYLQRYLVFGMEGVGKSHLLAMLALACLGEKADEGETHRAVCFIPALGSCLTDQDGVWKALVEAFVCDPPALAELDQLRRDHSGDVPAYLESLADFVNRRNVVVIAGRFDAVDKDAAGARTALGQGVANFISKAGQAGSSCRLVFAASPFGVSPVWPSGGCLSRLTKTWDKTPVVRIMATNDL